MIEEGRITKPNSGIVGEGEVEGCLCRAKDGTIAGGIIRTYRAAAVVENARLATVLPSLIVDIILLSTVSESSLKTQFYKITHPYPGLVPPLSLS